MLARHALSSSTVNVSWHVVGTVNATVLDLDAQVCVFVKVVAVTPNSYHESFPLPRHFLKLLTPSVNALNILVDICKNYAAKYYFMFNAKKSLLIIYKCTWKKPTDPNIYINNVKVLCINEVIFKFNESKCVADFNRQCNTYLASFKYANSNIKNVLFHKYCTAFYSS